jgi:hypothetical protein
MKHATQINLIHQIFDAIDRGTPPMAERFTRNDTSAYTSPQPAAGEGDVLLLLGSFGNAPGFQLIALKKRVAPPIAIIVPNSKYKDLYASSSSSEPHITELNRDKAFRDSPISMPMGTSVPPANIQSTLGKSRWSSTKNKQPSPKIRIRSGQRWDVFRAICRYDSLASQAQQ